MRPRLFCAAHDAGGCNAVLPVLEALKAEADIRAWADGPAWDILARAGWAPQRLRASEAAAAFSRAFGQEPPRLALVGSSVGASLEDALVSESRRRHVPSIGVLDAWIRYDQRFARGSDPWAYLPDALVVMDEHAKAEMAALGAPPERLLPLGQPQFDLLPGRLSSFTLEQRERVRSALGAPQGARLVLFLSQDMREYYGGRERALQTLGYDEFDALEALRDAAKAVSARRAAPLRLAVKLHPRETPGKFAALFEGPVVRGEDPYELMLGSDLVVGMDTLLLIEGGWLGCVTLSLQPRRRGADTLITGRLGLGRSCREPERLEGLLEDLLFDDAERAADVASMRRFPIQPGAARRIAELARSRLEDPRS
ncbi:MAG TPA: hypothetical protein DCM05_02585 [Elusimicrobia bacterium]|nr:hypothetical protein [Elusimicrobiota bacterium]